MFSINVHPQDITPSRVSVAMPQAHWSDCLWASLLTTVMLLVFHRSEGGSECPVCPSDLESAESLGLVPSRTEGRSESTWRSWPDLAYA